MLSGFKSAGFFRTEEMIGRVQVQTGQTDQPDVVVQARIRRAGDDIHAVPLVRERLAQVFNINALPAGRGIAPVRQQADSQRF